MAGPVTAVVSGQTKAPSPARPGTPGGPGDFRRANVQVCTLSISSESSKWVPGWSLGGREGTVPNRGRPGHSQSQKFSEARSLFPEVCQHLSGCTQLAYALENAFAHLRGVQAKPHRSLPLWLPTPHSRPYSGSWTLLTLSLPCSPGFLRPQRCQAGGLW